MNSTIYFALFIITAIFFFAIIVSWANRSKRKKEKKRRIRKFEDFVIGNGLTIDKKQKTNRNLIGIDRLNFKVVFFESKSESFQLIDLQKMHVCRLIKDKNAGDGHICRIYLQCVFKNKNIPDVDLPFYNAENDSVHKLMREAKKATFWEESINIYKKVSMLSEAVSHET